MATIEQEKKQRQALQTVLEQLGQIEPKSLVRTEELGKQLSFERGLPIFQRTLDLFEDFSDCELGNVPFELLQQLTALAQGAQSQFQRIQEFSIQKHPSNPAQARDQLITELQNQWNAYYGAISPLVAYTTRRATDFTSLEREARGALSLQTQLITEMKTEKGKIITEMQGALEKVRAAAAEAGVAQHAIHFKQEAESHQKQAYWWLASTVVFAALTIFYGLYSLGPQLEGVALSAPTGRLIQLALSRIVVISILSFGFIWSARNYAASRHNFVINRHRQNALSTFEAFVKAASDPQTKDAVLMQAAQSIFVPLASGYTKGETELRQGTQIVEVVRGLTGAKE